VFAKLVAVILGIGVVGGGLLAMRQQRLEAASELARVQVHLRVQDEQLCKLRAQIARRTSPEQVREMAVALGPLRPMIQTAGTVQARTRRASTDATIIDAQPLPRAPTGPVRLTPARATLKKTKPADSRYAIVETDR